jgi:hypothetical protein
MSALSLAEWGRLMDAGATTYTVGKVPGPYAAYLDRADAEAAADQADGTFIQWDGQHGRQVTTAEYDAETTAWQEPEPEAGQ